MKKQALKNPNLWSNMLSLMYSKSSAAYFEMHRIQNVANYHQQTVHFVPYIKGTKKVTVLHLLILFLLRGRTFRVEKFPRDVFNKLSFVCVCLSSSNVTLQKAKTSPKK